MKILILECTFQKKLEVMKIELERLPTFKFKTFISFLWLAKVLWMRLSLTLAVFSSYSLNLLSKVSFRFILNFAQYSGLSHALQAMMEWVWRNYSWWETWDNWPMIWRVRLSANRVVRIGVLISLQPIRELYVCGNEIVARPTN